MKFGAGPSRYVWQPTPGNSLQVLSGGPEFYPRILEDIESAQTEVLLGTYLWEDDETGRRFLEAARVAAARGLRVRVLLDGIGGRRVQSSDLAALKQAGGKVCYFHALRFPLFDSRLMRRFHRKLVLIDGRVAYTGGAGFADGWLQQAPEEWWDLMVRVEGPVVPQLRRLFVTDWKRATKERLPDLRDEHPAIAPGAHQGDRGDQTLHTLVTRRGRPELQRRLRIAIHEARDSVSLTNAYFVPSFLLRRALTRAAQRGVHVRLLLPGPRTDHFAVWNAGRRYYRSLLQRGVRIFEFQRSMLHSKYAVADQHWGYVGSSNLDNWSRHFNLELDLGIHSATTLTTLQGQFERDLESAREIRLAQWEARPLSLRLMETLFGWFDPLL